MATLNLNNPPGVFSPRTLDLISSTQGSILYRGVSGWQALPPATPGYILQTNGPNANPSWNAINATTGVSVTPANDTTDVTNDIQFISSGDFLVVKGSSENLVIKPTAGTVIKRADALWVAGNNQGGSLVSLGTSQNNVYFFVIYNPTTNVIDYAFDTSITAANRPLGFTHYRCVGWNKWSGSAWRLFDMVGTHFRWRDVNAFSTFSDGTTTNRTVDAPSEFNCVIRLILTSGTSSSDSTGRAVWFGQINEIAPLTLDASWRPSINSTKTVYTLLYQQDVRVSTLYLDIISISGQIKTRATVATTSTVTNSGHWFNSDHYPGYLVQSIDLQPILL